MAIKRSMSRAEAPPTLMKKFACFGDTPSAAYGASFQASFLDEAAGEKTLRVLEDRAHGWIVGLRGLPMGLVCCDDGQKCLRVIECHPQTSSEQRSQTYRL